MNMEYLQLGTIGIILYVSDLLPKSAVFESKDSVLKEEVWLG